AVRVHSVSLHGRHRRRALCAAGRHHQSRRIGARQFHRGGDLGRGRRPRHAHRRRARRRAGQLRQNLLHIGRAGAVLAVHARQPVHRRDIAIAARRHRHLASLDGAAPRPRLGRCRRRRQGAASGGMKMEALTTALLYLDGVNVSFDGFKALNKLSFTIEPGEMRAIIGPNGAGKTTMMDVVTGKTRPDAGEVVFDGSHDLTKLDESEIAELGIGRKFQKPTVFEMHTVEDNILLALKSDRRPRATLFWRDTAESDRRIDGILQITRLTAVRDRVAGGLSHGQKQWLEIGMLLAQEPKVLLVDEPVAGMTDVETQQTAELLKEINREKTVMVVEHDMTFVRELGVKVTCLHEGSVLAEGTIDQVSSNERVIEVYLGR